MSTGFSTEAMGDRFRVEAHERAVFRLEVPNLVFNSGSYVSNFGLMDGPEFIVRADNPILRVKANPLPQWGVVSVPHTWRRADENHMLVMAPLQTNKERV